MGSFVNLRNGHACPDSIRASEERPLRVFLLDGRNDNRGLRQDGSHNETRDWFVQNLRVQKALEERGYDLNRVCGIQRRGHGMLKLGFPDLMRWLWRDHTLSSDPRDMVERSFNEPKANP